MNLSTLGIAIAIIACRDILAPLERLGADTASKYLNGTGRVVVYPDSMRGWTFYNDQQGAACTDTTVCRFVGGPGSAPVGSGSAELAVSATSDGKALILVDYKGVLLDQLTTLSYSTYRQTTNSGNNLAISLQLNADFDLTDNATGYQGRLVYEPYLTASGSVGDSTWQSWNAKAGKWWGTKSTVSKGGVTVSNPCVQSAPCTWSQLVAAFPNAGIHNAYGAVVLKAGSGWTNFRGNVDNLVIGIDGSTTTFDFELAAPAATVSATAPDSVPKAVWDSLRASSNILVNPPGYAGSIIRNALLVTFKPSATQAERQSAIDLVGGTVVGGVPLGEPERMYLVRIPYALSAGDSVSGPVLRAAATLRGLAVIHKALIVPNNELVTHYRRPKGGPSYRVWPLSRDSLLGANWAQIGVNGPFAWGCATGSQLGQTPPLVAVADRGFHDIEDLSANGGPLREFSPVADTSKHGTMVASVLGAVGGNDLGMTGMMWKARINMFDTRFDSSAVPIVRWTAAAQRAARSGARVINISWGLNPEPLHALVGTPAYEAALQDARDYFSAALEASRDSTGRIRALFVVSSGDFLGRAEQAGWPGLVQDARYSDNIMVVAQSYRSSSSEQRLAPEAASGPNVQLVALGKGVTALDASGVPITVDGSSFAAPLVAGAAGLLFAFDSTLTPADVKNLLIQGARLGGREVSDPLQPVNTIPILDAYASLRLAARRPSAPLCGNRVYANGNGEVFADRGPSNQPEKLFTSVDAPYADLLNSLHGGRRIQIGDYLEYKWSPNTRTWSESSFDGNYHQDAGGAFLSWYDGSDHDATRYLINNGQPNQGSVYFTPQLFTLPAQSPLGAMSQVVRPLRNMIGNLACTYGTIDSLVTNVACPNGATTFIGSGEYPDGVSALAPQGDFALVGINYRMQSQSYAQTYNSIGMLRPTTDNMRDTSVSIELWRVDSVSLHDGSRPPTRIKLTNFSLGGDDYSRNGLEIAWLAIDETGTEIVWELRKRFSNYTANVFTCTNRVIEYRALAGHAPAAVGGLPVEEGQLLHADTLPNLNRQCPSSYGPATFSPYRGSVARGGGRAGTLGTDGNQR